MQENKKIFLTMAILICFLVGILNVSALNINNVVSDPKEIAPGESAKIIFDLENNLGQDVENVNVLLDFSSAEIPIAPYQDSAEDGVDELNDGDEEKFTFNIIALPNAISGIYKIPVKISYVDSNNTPVEKDSTISIIVNSPPKIRVSSEGSLIKGKESVVILRIVNDGLTNAKFASVQFLQPLTGTLNSPLYEYLGNIDSDDFDTIELKIFTSSESSGTLTLPVKINYKDSTNKDFSQDEKIVLRAYTNDEAVELGLAEGPNYIVYTISGIIALYGVYWLLKRIIKRRRAQGG